MNQSYPSDLTAEQWQLLLNLLPAAKSGGRPRRVDLQAVLNAVFYVLCNGCIWRALPHDFPNWKTVYHYFHCWRIDGTWKQIHDKLRSWLRVSEGREASPSAAILDSQSVETATMVAKAVGIDGGKLVKGRKRHVLVDTLGLLLIVVVTAANVSEQAGAKLVFAKLQQLREHFSRLVRIWVDGGYQGKEFMEWVMDSYRWVVEVVLRPDALKGFVVIHERWKVEIIQPECLH